MRSDAPNNKKDITSYGSARDLPSFREMLENLEGFKLLSPLLEKASHQEIAHLEDEVNRITGVVDGFYDLLGPRNWVFHDQLNLNEVEKIVNESKDVGIAEKRFVEIYRDNGFIQRNIRRFVGEENMRGRLHQIHRAHEHYISNHFDSCSMQLIAAMDGFVNDHATGGRKGLHARKPEDMFAWDSVINHHKGLQSVMRVFNKKIYKRVDDEVFELHRNGIMHGMVVNFNNDTVATKAWNMLFAIADWSASKLKAEQPKEPEPSPSELLLQLSRNNSYTRYRRGFAPHTIVSSETGFGKEKVVTRVSELLESWEKKQWGVLVEFMTPRLREMYPGNKAINHTKSLFGQSKIRGWTINEVSFAEPSVALIKCTTIYNDNSAEISLRMVLLNDSGSPAIPSEEAEWYLGIWNPNSYLLKKCVRDKNQQLRPRMP